MKIQAVVVLAAFLLLATLVNESDGFSAPVQNGKRALKGEVRKAFLFNPVTAYLAFITQLVKLS